MIDLFLAVLMASFAVYFLTDTLLLVSSDLDTGPFESEEDMVVWVKVISDGVVERDYRKVNLWDRVRRVFGLYEIMVNVQLDDDTSPTKAAERVWYIKPERSGLWTCPHCLGFWMGIIPAIIVAFAVEVPLAFFLLIWPIAGAHSILVSIIDALYNTTEADIISLMDEDNYDSDSI